MQRSLKQAERKLGYYYFNFRRFHSWYPDITNNLLLQVSLYQNQGTRFKRNSSIDNALWPAYRTIIPQTMRFERLTAGKFFSKNLEKWQKRLNFLMPQESGVDDGCDYIVKSVRSGCYAKAPNGKTDREINARYRPESELGEIEG